MEYFRDGNRVHPIVYHLVCTPNRRKPVLIGDVAADYGCLIKKKCGAGGWPIYGTGSQP